jgi:hypothetical protein
VRRRAAALGTLFGRLGDAGDAVLVALPVDPSRLQPVHGLASPRLIVDARDTTDPASPLRWARTDAAGRGANDRGAWLPWCGAHDALLPGSGLVSDRSGLERHLASGGADASPERRWSLAAPFGSSGRRRILGRADRGDAAVFTAASRLLDLFGRAVFTPWMDRVLDLGSASWTPEGDVLLHAAEVDRVGRFRGIRTALPDSVTEEHRTRLRHITRAVGQELAQRGYAGPFGVDAFLHRDAQGQVRLHPLCEVNARQTFGALAHALVPRVCAAGETATLRLGGALDLARAVDAVPLLLPAADDDTAAWIERDRVPV